MSNKTKRQIQDIERDANALARNLSRVTVGPKTVRPRRKRRSRSARAQNYAALMGVAPNRTRSGTTPNPADPRSKTAFNQLGSTAPGRLAALKILHPNGENDTYTTKFPDGSATTSILMERRDEYDLQSGLTIGDWNCLVIDTPFLFMTQLAIRWPGTESPDVTDIQAAVVDALSLPGSDVRRYPAWESAIHGTTDFEITVLTSVSLVDTYIATEAGVQQQVKSLRRTYLGSTTTFDANSLTDAGRVVAGQWRPDVSLLNVTINGAVPPAALTAAVYSIQAPASDTNSIVSTDELVYQGAAKLGLYMPNRLSEMDPSFTAASEYRTIAPFTPDNITPTLSANEPRRRDTWLRGWLIGCSLWTGMDHTTQLRIKRKEGIEIISAPTGSFAPFASPALPSDLRAQQMIQEFSRCEPHAFPEDYNSLGKMLKNIVGGVSSALANLGLPIISDVASSIQHVVNGDIGNTVAGALDSIGL